MLSGRHNFGNRYDDDLIALVEREYSSNLAFSEQIDTFWAIDDTLLMNWNWHIGMVRNWESSIDVCS
jgi:hypothetical protein